MRRYYLLLIVFFILAAGLWMTARRLIATDGGKTSTQASSNQSPAQSLPTADNALQLPILMYHHIRDYDNPGDSLGTRLSVSVTTFSEQLDWLAANDYQTLTFKDLQDNESIPERAVILTFDDGYDNFYLSAYPALKNRNMSAVVFVITDRINTEGYLDDSQIRDLARNGIEIGSHSVTHPNLTTLSNDQLRFELRQSNTLLHNLIGSDILTFCYPAGLFDERVMEQVQSEGYQYAVTTRQEWANFTNSLQLGRFRMTQSTSLISRLPL